LKEGRKEGAIYYFEKFGEYKKEKRIVFFVGRNLLVNHDRELETYVETLTNCSSNSI